MEQFAYSLSQSIAAKTDTKLVTWGGTGRRKAVLIALPYLSLRAFVALSLGDIDIIHVNDGLMAPTGYLLSRLFHKPYVVVIHGLDMTYRNRLFEALVPAAVRHASKVYCISQATAEEARKHGVPDDKIIVEPLAVQDDIFQKSSRSELLSKLGLPDDSQTLLTVGRLVKRKGVAWFIENALPELVRQFPQIIYLVLGEGEQRATIEATIQKAGLADHVRLLGKADDDLYRAAYNGADIFVMPNIEVPGDMEGFGLVVLEAALCELPVVAAGTEGISDAISDGQNGYLVPSGDTVAFQDRISQLLLNPARAKQFGGRSRIFTLKNYRWDKIATSYIEGYQQVLNR